MKRLTLPDARKELITYINKWLTPSDRVLDLGCGTKEIANSLVTKNVVTLDAWKAFEPDIWCNLEVVPKLPCSDNSYDAVLMIDVIEHLTKAKGKFILKEAKRVTKQYVILLTPLWWDPNLNETKDPKSAYYQNEFNKHLSLWDFKDLPGFESTVIPTLDNYFIGGWRKNGTK